MQDGVHSTEGQVEYRHTNGAISTVRISTPGMGMRRVRIANLPADVSDEGLRSVPSRYGGVKDVQAETLSHLYRYPVASGLRFAKNTLAIHNPSHVIVAGNLVLCHMMDSS
jgi:hypothetical protein